MFVCLGFIVPLENFSFIWRRHHYWWRAANLCSALKTIEQRGFFGVPNYSNTSDYHGHLLGPMTLAPIIERLVVELSLPVFTTKVCRAEIWTPTFRLRCERSNPIRHRGVFNIHWGIHISGQLYFFNAFEHSKACINYYATAINHKTLRELIIDWSWYPISEK